MKNEAEDMLEPLEPVQPAQPAKKGPPKGVQPAHLQKLRHVHPPADHETIYSSGCHACRAEDEKRRNSTAQHIADEDLARTVFFIPNFDPELGIALEYLKQRYRGKAKNISHTVKWTKLLSLSDFQVVLVRRVPREGEELESHIKEVATEVQHIRRPMYRRHAELTGQILESAPVAISEFANEAVFSLSDQVNPKVDELIIVLQDIVGPNFRIMKHNEPDVTMTFAMA